MRSRSPGGGWTAGAAASGQADVRDNPSGVAPALGLAVILGPPDRPLASRIQSRPQVGKSAGRAPSARRGSRRARPQEMHPGCSSPHKEKGSRHLVASGADDRHVATRRRSPATVVPRVPHELMIPRP